MISPFALLARGLLFLSRRELPRGRENCSRCPTQPSNKFLVILHSSPNGPGKFPCTFFVARNDSPDGIRHAGMLRQLSTQIWPTILPAEKKKTWKRLKESPMSKYFSGSGHQACPTTLTKLNSNELCLLPLWQAWQVQDEYVPGFLPCFLTNFRL